MRRPVAGRVEPVDLEAGHQLREALPGDAQLARGAGDAAMAPQGVADHRALQALARLGERRPALGGHGLPEGGRQGVGADGAVAGSGDGQVGEHVLQLADVAGPRVRRQGGHRLARQCRAAAGRRRECPSSSGR